MFFSAAGSPQRNERHSTPLGKSQTLCPWGLDFLFFPSKPALRFGLSWSPWGFVCFWVERKNCKEQATQKTTFTQAFLTEVRIGSSIFPSLKRDGCNSGGLVRTLKSRKGMKLWVSPEQRPELTWLQVFWDERNIWMNKYITIVTANLHTYYMLGAVLSTLYVFTYFSQEPYKISNIIVSIL